MIKLISDLPDGAIGFEASGIVSASEYEAIVIPTVDAAAAGGRKLRMLYHVTPGFEKFEVGAMWDDAKVGLKHLASWEKIAVVTDVGWIRTGVKIIGFAIPGEVQVFDNGGLSDAKAWLGY